METVKSFLSENQELCKPVKLDECAALNGGLALVSGMFGDDGYPRPPLPIVPGPIVHHGPHPGPFPV